MPLSPLSHKKFNTVARFCRSLKTRGIPFHRNDNKARLFLLYNSPTNTTATATKNPALPASLPEPITANLAQLLHPSTTDTRQPREMQTIFGPVQHCDPCPSRSKDPTPAEFALAFSLFCDTIGSVFPSLTSELDDYLSIILDMALCFGSTGFCSYHLHFTNQVANRIKQFNQNTYWGTLDSELYCRIFAARTSLSRELCGAPYHPATACIVSAPPPRPRSSSSHNTTVFNCLSPAAPPPSIVPKPLDIQPAISVHMPKGVDMKGRPILYQAKKMVCKKLALLTDFMLA
ncbi:leucine-rich repeat extensin 2 [Xyrichtys novacula]|uniref:Leucine-rich repeat extensin 2 n=1 Tax=Xyrichtys novacula TaxID=13765 RepID=A0AAV1EML0_XYRNO|nr:leucine-rich repeat extensin 2 [Xyrichtys novacula]